jgi:hypothetical protein
MIKGGVILKRTELNYKLITNLSYIKVINPTARPMRECDAWVGGTYNPKMCGLLAEFTYTAGKTKKAHSRTGNYCWRHLFTHAIMYKVYDKARAERAWKKQEKEENRRAKEARSNGS